MLFRGWGPVRDRELPTGSLLPCDFDSKISMAVSVGSSVSSRDVLNRRSSVRLTAFFPEVVFQNTVLHPEKVEYVSVSSVMRHVLRPVGTTEFLLHSRLL